MSHGRAPASTEEDGRIVEKIISKHANKLPEGVKRIDFEFGEDSTGDPAVRVFVVTDDLAPAKDQAAAIYDLTDALRSEIIAAGTLHWPYVRIRVEG